MATAAAITIRRQVLAVEVRGTQADGLDLQRRLPGICADVLAPAIESALAPYDPGDAHLGIDRLEIDVSVALDRFEVELAEQVRRELTAWFRAHPPGPEGSASAAPDGEVRRRTPAQTLDDALLAFLAAGRLPWSVDVPAGTSLEELIMESWGAAGQPPTPAAGLRGRLAAVLATARARTRLVLQFSAAFRTVVLQAIAPDVAAAVDEVTRTVTGSVPAVPRDIVGPLLREVAEVALAAAVAGARPEPAELVAQARARVPAASTSAPQLRSLDAVLEQHWPDAAATVPVPEHPTRPRGEPARDTDAAAGDSAAPTRPTAPSPRIPADDEGSILVDSAGLVLLHPLATGERTAPEHRVTLAKVLCGLPLDEPVPLQIGLRTEEIAEATALLEAVIDHWTALRDTSPDGLRGEFLTRPGLLTVTPDGDWLLRVEARTADILLADLPWGFGMFRLPWMTAMVQVEWR